MKVKLFDETEFNCCNREDCVRIIKRELKNWMNENDKILWYYSDGIVSDKPNYAIVVTEYYERTDAYAFITE